MNQRNTVEKSSGKEDMYKDSLNLPSTHFPMKGNLNKKEPEILAWWNSIGAYARLRELRKGSPQYILHDGPPYSNGHIHMGTAVNKIVKDMIVRSKTMGGYDSPFLPGWDNHGMPIEIQVMKEFRKKGEDAGTLEIRKRCGEYADNFVGIQREEFIKLGVWGEWDTPYLTMSKQFESTIIHIFGQLVEKGFVYRGLRPIHWCTSCGTALAEAEIEYREKISHSITLRFPLKEDPDGIFPADIDGYVLIWTTTPWTIPANMAVVVHPDYDYCLLRAGDAVYLLAERLAPVVMESLGVNDYSVISKHKGRDLAGLVFKHPLYDRPSPLYLARHVTLEDGTGVVHTAPGHGTEDFLVGQAEGIDIFCPVDERGRFTDEAGVYKGLEVEAANQVIIDDLSSGGYLLEHGEITHQYPHCWRCQNSLLFRATIQWFLSIDHNGLRNRALDIIENEVEWIPGGSKNRILGMVGTRPDWCLSRQRVWGIGIPVIFCNECGEPVMDSSLIYHIADVIGRSGGDSWFEKDVTYFLPEGFRSCPACSGESFRKETDILDVWFESGSSHQVALKGSNGLRFPADMYFEGSDQHRGWFNTSLMVAVATEDQAPYRKVVTHGWILDEEGKAMHKSLGNVVSPIDVMKNNGADILRLWTAANDFRADIRFSHDSVKQARDVYRRIRNTCRYLLGNLSDFSPDQDSVDLEDFWAIDKYALFDLQKFKKKILDFYDKQEFHQIFHLVNNYCTVNLSSFYLDILKDRLYTFGKRSKARRAAQTVLKEILDTLSRVLAPLIPFTAEEIWREIPWCDDDSSVHWQLLPIPETLELDEVFLSDWETLIGIRTVVLKCLEEARMKKAIGSSLEASVRIQTSKDDLKVVLDRHLPDLASLFIVSTVELSQKEPGDQEVVVEDPEGNVIVGVRKSPHAKCSRCWNYSETVGESIEHPRICHKCFSNLNQG